MRVLLRSIARTASRGVNLALETAFPWDCFGCGATSNDPVCDGCLGRVSWLSAPLCSSCGIPLETGPERPCATCLARPPVFRRLRALARYRPNTETSDPLALAIHAVKYGRRRGVARFLSRLVAERPPVPPWAYDATVPVPLHLDRLRERGFNQAALLGRDLRARHSLPLRPLVLERVRPTPPQIGLSPSERRRNLDGAIRLRRGQAVRGERILLLDDVATSTATANACARALLDAGAEAVDVLVLARAITRN